MVCFHVECWLTMTLFGGIAQMLLTRYSTTLAVDTHLRFDIRYPYGTMEGICSHHQASLTTTIAAPYPSRANPKSQQTRLD